MKITILYTVIYSVNVSKFFQTLKKQSILNIFRIIYQLFLHKFELN